ncbi:MAG: NUDIX hydrolase, partial [Clostridia bacterium]|nr:NUDIX hydrolase [Clostridia bacterium]
SVGYTDEIIHVFLAEKFEFVGRRLDEGEFLNSVFMEIDEVINLIESGELCDAKTVAAVYAYLNLKK